MSNLTEKEIYELFDQITEGDTAGITSTRIIRFARAVELLVMKKLIRAIAARVGDDAADGYIRSADERPSERDRKFADMCRRVENSDGPVEYMDSRPPVWSYGRLILARDGYAMWGDLTIKVTLEQARHLCHLASNRGKN